MGTIARILFGAAAGYGVYRVVQDAREQRNKEKAELDARFSKFDERLTRVERLPLSVTVQAPAAQPQPQA